MMLRRIDLLEAFIESRVDGDTVFSQDLVDYFEREKQKYPDRMKKVLDINLRMATSLLRSSERVVGRRLTRHEQRTYKRDVTYIFTIMKG